MKRRKFVGESLAILAAASSLGNEIHADSKISPINLKSTFMGISTKIWNEAQALSGYTLAMHKAFATEPELSWHEIKATSRIANELSALGIPYRITKRGVGVIAWIDGAKPESQTVMLRADIDSLPIEAEKQVKDKLFPSSVPGVESLCGHSAHTAISLSVARLLWARRSQFEGKLVVLFQPAEELATDPGCKYLIEEEGILEEFPNIVAAFGLHVTPEYLPGDIHLTPGVFMASVSEFEAAFISKQGHIQHVGGNTIDAAFAFYNRTMSIHTQLKQPLESILLAPAKIHSNTWNNEVSNLLPSETHLTLVFRTFDKQLRDAIGERLIQMAQDAARDSACRLSHKLTLGIVPVKNDPELTQWGQAKLEEILGTDHVKEATKRLGGDDIGFISERVPTLYLRLGSGGEPQFAHKLHSPEFQVNPACLPIGVAALAWLAFCKLQL